MSDEKISTVATATILNASISGAVLANGRNTEPSLRFSNSTSTGMYSDVSKTIKFASNGTNVFNIGETAHETVNPIRFTANGSGTGSSNDIYMYKSGANLYINNGTEYKLGGSSDTPSFKATCRLSSTASVTLAGGAPNSVDGSNLNAGDRILVRRQASTAENGIYSVTSVGTGSNGTWTRADDANSADKFAKGMVVHVSAGTENANTVWYLTTSVSVLNTDAIVFDQLYPSSTGSSLNLTSGGAVNNGLTSTAYLEKIGKLRSIRLQSNINTASSAATITLSTLPADFRPFEDLSFVIRGRDNAADKVCTLVVGTNGVITISNGLTSGDAFTNATNAGYYHTVLSWICA